jgi:hypothetical protein
MAADRGLDTIDRLTEDFHVYPDFHGNRSPVADPTLKGMVTNIYIHICFVNYNLNGGTIREFSPLKAIKAK